MAEGITAGLIYAIPVAMPREPNKNGDQYENRLPGHESSPVICRHTFTYNCEDNSRTGYRYTGDNSSDAITNLGSIVPLSLGT